MFQKTGVFSLSVLYTVLLSVHAEFDKQETNVEGKIVKDILSNQRPYFEEKLTEQQNAFNDKLAEHQNKFESLLERQEQLIKAQEKKLLKQDNAIKQLQSLVKADQGIFDDFTAKTSKTTLQNARRQAAVGPVAFYATTDRGEIPHLTGNQKLPLDLVLMNYGAGFHKERGVFTAPVSGIYIFTASVLASRGYNSLIQAQIMKDGQVVGSMYAHGQDNQFEQGSMTVAVHLGVGNEVWLAVDYALNDVTLYGHRYTSFTGFLLYLI